jgi:hypothetical protein
MVRDPEDDGKNMGGKKITPARFPDIFAAHFFADGLSLCQPPGRNPKASHGGRGRCHPRSEFWPCGQNCTGGAGDRFSAPPTLAAGSPHHSVVTLSFYDHTTRVP